MSIHTPAFDSTWFNTIPTPLFEFDFSKIKKHISSLSIPKDTSLRPYLEKNPHILNGCISCAKISAVNKSALELYGVKTLDELESHLNDIIGKNGLTTLLSGTLFLLEGATHFEEETMNTRIDGTPIRVILKFALVPGYEESLKRVIISIHDITKNKQLEKQIGTLTLLPEVNPNIVLILECPDVIEYVNPAGRKWLAYHDFTDLNDIHHLMPEEFKDKICGPCNRISDQKHKIEYQDEVYDFKLKPLAGADRCMITLTDVTEMERIVRERQLYFEAFQSSIQAMMITDPQGRIQYVNPKFEEIYGFSLSEALGKSPRILNPGKAAYYDLGYTEEEYETIFTGMWKKIQDPAIGFWEGELPNRKKDGTIVWVHLIINAIYCEQGTLTNFLAMPIDITETRNRELNIRLDIYHTITHLAEMRDNETGNHIIRVGKFAGTIARQLNMPKKFCEDIETFSPLHDIGKVGISDLILLAERKLTTEEFTVMKTHTTLGYQLLLGKPTLEMAAEIALNHHERYDGKGYPHGIAGEKIPLCARITTIVDIYDALRSTRPYKEAWNHKNSIAEIQKLSGSVLDPSVTQAFLAKEKEVISIAGEYGD